MQKLIISITNPDSEVCLAGIVCANDTFIAIYGVIFTIVISLGVYIYGLQNKDEKITLLKSTDIRGVIESSLGFFALTFLALPSPIYEVINFVFVGWVLLRLLGYLGRCWYECRQALPKISLLISWRLYLFCSESVNDFTLKS
jgi:hypothetical protein